MSKDLTYKKIFVFWIPLAMTWLMMAIEGPFIAALIARLAEPKFNLAAYGVAYSFAIIVEAPIIMIMSATTALVKNKDSFLKMRKFTYMANLMITMIMLFILIPPVFDFITLTVINLPEKIANLIYKATLIFIPWPAAIGFRRLYQGILIISDKTRRVAYGTVIRLLTMAVVSLGLYLFAELDGVAVGAAALSAGVIAEALASRWMAKDYINKLMNKEDLLEGREPLNFNGIYKFYYPLALTSILSLAVHPAVTFFMGQSKLPIESLAILPVVNSLVFIFRSLGLSFHEVGIALMGENFEGYKKLRNFAAGLTIFALATLYLIALTPLSTVWFHHISGLSMELTDLAILPLIIVAILPGLSVFMNFQRAVLVYSHNTKPLSKATAIEVLGIVLVLFITVELLGFIGVVAAVCGFVFGRSVANFYLFPPFIKAVKENKNNQSINLTPSS